LTGATGGANLPTPCLGRARTRLQQAFAQQVGPAPHVSEIGQSRVFSGDKEGKDTEGIDQQGDKEVSRMSGHDIQSIAGIV